MPQLLGAVVALALYAVGCYIAIIYLVGLVVVVMFVLSLIGLR